MNISLFPFVPEKLVSRDGFGRRPVPRQPALILHTPAESSIINHQSSIINLVLTRGIPPDFRASVRLFISSTAIGSVPNLSGHAIAYRWRSLLRVRRHRARNGCCLFRDHHVPVHVRLSFPTPTIGMKCDTKSTINILYRRLSCTFVSPSGWCFSTL